MSMTIQRKRAIARMAEPALLAAKLCDRTLRYVPSRLTRRPKVVLPLPATSATDRMTPRREPRRILVVRLDSIGDVLLSEPAIAALRKRHPKATIDAAVGPLGRAILDGNPAIDSFITYDAPWHSAWRGSTVSWWQEVGKLLQAARVLHRRKYDLAVELRGDFRDIVFALLSGASAVVGCGWRGGHSLLDYDVPFDTEVHQVSFALAIAGGAGADPSPRPPFLVVEEREHTRAAALLQGLDATLIGVHLGAGFPSKCLPVDRFAAVANRVFDRWSLRYGPPPAFVVVGGNDEKAMAEQFRRSMTGRSIDLTGRLSLKETAAVLARCRLFIGNDSGPMHLAAAMGTPVVTFFGPSEPFRFHPYGVPYHLLEVDLPCRPCDFVHCVHSDHRCLSSLGEERIIQVVEQSLTEQLVVSQVGV